MTQVLRKDWRDDMMRRMLEFKEHKRDKFEFVTTIPIAKKWLIIRLHDLGIQFVVHNLGAGVTKITTDAGICPKCHGKGRV